MAQVFEEIKVKKVSEQIVDQIKQLMQNGKLLPGQRLPPERELAENLGVGRPSLREALNILHAQGLIEIRKRQGIFVRSISSSLTYEPLKRFLEENGDRLPQLYELRHDLELASAYLAAKRRTGKDLEAIWAAILDIKEKASGSIAWWQHDAGFHLAIAQATRNLLRVHVLKDLFDLAQVFAEDLFNTFAQDEPNLAILVEQHERVYEAIKDQDCEAARRLMNEHLDYACSLLEKPDGAAQGS